jgi:hypothetical protein
MKKLFTLCFALSFVATSFAGVSSVIKPKSKPVKVNASEVLIPIGSTGQKISLLDLSNIKLKEFEKLKDQKMKLGDKINFKFAQGKLRNSINADGTIKNNKLVKATAKKAEGSSGVNLGGLALGFFLGPIGVLIAYVISDDNKRARTKWAWIGFAAALVLSLLFLL